MACNPSLPMHTLQAAVLRKKGGPLTLEALEMEGPRDDEVLVRLVASGICHTDIGFINDWDEADIPVVLGHEGAGVVERAGREVKGVKPGDHVLLSYQSCGHCPKCRSNKPAHCRRFWEANFGFARLDGSNALARSGVRGHFFGQSSFATLTLATARNLVRVPQDLPLELLAPLGCGLQTGAGTVFNSLKVRQGESVAVFGAGAVGLAAIMAARLAGAAPIIAVDRVQERLELALELGATQAINNRHEDIASRVAAFTGGGVDYLLETTGDPRLCRLAVELLNPAGTLALIATPGNTELLPAGRRVLGIIQGDAVPQYFIAELIKLYRAGQFPFDRLVRFYDFHEINRAIADAESGRTVKPVLRIGSGCSRRV